MAGIVDDTTGQWIVLSGLTISVTLILIAVLLNQASVTGYYSSYAALEFPKEPIRELTVQTRDSSQSAAQLAWELNHTSNESVLSNFTVLLGNYSTEVSTIYAAHGRTVNITLYSFTNTNDTYIYTSSSIPIFDSTHRIETIWLNISYNDGTLHYTSDPEMIEVKQ